jgi:hypothetical protein
MSKRPSDGAISFSGADGKVTATTGVAVAAARPAANSADRTIELANDIVISSPGWFDPAAVLQRPFYLNT